MGATPTDVGTAPPTRLPETASDSTLDVVDGVAFARLYGEPLFQVPEDLYIPPDALKVFLEAFEGPLDLLLYLIRRQNFNVLDVPMAEVTRQYLGYIEQIRASNLELAAEYLLMAAFLIEIKSRTLLPTVRRSDGETVEDPRAELVRRLLAYEQMKLASQRLDALPVVGRDFLHAVASVDIDAELPRPLVSAADLHAGWLSLIERARLGARHRITREELSVRDHMGRILRALGQVRFIEFSQLLESPRNAAVLIVHFLALLELARESLIDVTQADAYAPIYLRLSFPPA